MDRAWGRFDIGALSRGCSSTQAASAPFRLPPHLEDFEALVVGQRSRVCAAQPSAVLHHVDVVEVVDPEVDLDLVAHKVVELWGDEPGAALADALPLDTAHGSLREEKRQSLRR